MGCKCNERRQAIGRAVVAVANGDGKAVVAAAAYVGRTVAQDVQSGALKQAALQNLARLVRR